MKTRTILSALVLLVCTVTALSQTRGPAATVKAFYKFSNTRSAVFNRRHVESRKQWYSPELYRTFLNELREQEVFLTQHPTDKPFFGDGLDFRPLDEPCVKDGKHYRRSQRISSVNIVRTRAYVEVEFAYPKACTIEAPILYRVQLKKLAGKWLLDDWTYSDGTTLTRDMKENGP